MIPCYKLTLGFGNIKWQTVRFCNTRYEEDNKTNELRNKEPPSFLCFNNFTETKAVSHHHHTHKGKSHEYLICEHLSRCTHSSYQRIFIAVSYTHLRAHETVLDLVC